MADFKLTGATFSVNFPREEGVRRKANELEDFLLGSFPTGYTAPLTVPVPSEMDPEVPRLVFSSSHGFNQILVSQVAISLQVQFSPDWQVNHGAALEYVRKRVPVLFGMFSKVRDGGRILFSGASFVAHLPRPTGEEAVHAAAGLLANTVASEDVNEITLRTSRQVADTFFRNVQYQTYRTWEPAKYGSGVIPPLPFSEALEAGVEVTCDYNDRYAYNETPNYASTEDKGFEVVQRSYLSLLEAVLLIKGD